MNILEFGLRSFMVFTLSLPGQIAGAFLIFRLQNYRITVFLSISLKVQKISFSEQSCRLV
jgi:hypothetical protein